MKLHIGSGHLEGEFDPLHLYDEASVELLRLGRAGKTRRQRRRTDLQRDEDIHVNKRAGRREGPDAVRSPRHGR